MQRMAVIGFGFSGVMLVANLVRRASSPIEIYIIDPLLNARGVAYSTPYAEHLLNVRAANMGAWADDVGHFHRWLSAQGHAYSATDFVPRQLYGAYLEDIFFATQNEAAAKRIFLKLVPSEAVALRMDAENFAVLTVRGDAIAVDRVVLATGNEMKPIIPPLDAPVLQNPWLQGAVYEAAVQPGPVLLMGTGLTAIDMVLALRTEGYRGTIGMMSRHALLPHAHRDAAPATTPSGKEIAAQQSLQQWARWMRKKTHAAADWRQVIDALRPFTQTVWQKLSLREQKAFLGRLLSFWNVHRHRMAPQIAAQLDAEIAAGSVQLMSRRALRDWALHPSLVINCTGPELDVTRSRAPLLQQLLASRMIEPHATGLGIAADPRLRAWGELHPNLYAMGALLTGQLLESTAVPELRAQAALIAEELCK